MSLGSRLSGGSRMATTPVQTESTSRRILSNLLSKLRLPDSPYKRFSEIVNQTNQADQTQFEELIYRFVRIDILAVIDSGNLGSIQS